MAPNAIVTKNVEYPGNFPAYFLMSNEYTLQHTTATTTIKSPLLNENESRLCNEPPDIIKSTPAKERNVPSS